MELRTDKQIVAGARLAIFNTDKSPERQKQMSNFGFTLKRMQEGRGLLEDVTSLQDQQTNHYDERWIISKQLKTDRKAVLAVFKDHVIVARTAFRHTPEVLHTLKIQRIATKVTEWPQQALHFYTKLEEYQAQLTPFGLTAEIIAQAKASAEALIEKKEDRIERKGVAESSTEAKRKAIKALKAWVVEFRSVARNAFRNNPQVLEVYGIKVASKV